MQLTDAKIKALKPQPERYLVSDGEGLSLYVLPSGKMSWFFRYRRHGKQEKVTLGQYPAMSLKAARDARKLNEGNVAKGKSPATEKKLARAGLAIDPTVREFGEKYFSEVVERDWKDPRNLRRYLDKDVYPSLGEKPLKDITPADIQAVVFRKRDNGAPAAAGQLRNLLKGLFDYAVGCQAITVNPVLSLPARFVTRARSRTRALPPDEIRKYLQTLYKSNVRRQFKLALHLILLTLVRKSEMLLAHWEEEINFDEGAWEIPAERTKNGKPHIVYLSSQAVELLLELRALAGNSELVLPGRSSLKRPFAANALNKALEGVNFEMEPFTIHDMRRTASTLLHEKGFPSDVIEKALNHTIGGVRGVYNKAEYAEQRKKMLQFWSDYVEGLASEKKVLVGNFGIACTSGHK